MADRVPINFRKSPEAITTFPFSDISEGTGTSVFFGAATETSGSVVSFFLSTNPTYSGIIASGSSISSTTYTKIFDHDYDVKFNLSKRIKGDMRVTLTLGSFKGTDPNECNAYAHIKIRKWDGTTETEIADKQSAILRSPNTTAPSTISQTVNVEIPITTTQHFEAGETLRVTVEIYGKRNDTETITIGYGFDPKDRDDDNAQPVIEDADTTIMEVHIPFLLNL